MTQSKSTTTERSLTHHPSPGLAKMFLTIMSKATPLMLKRPPQVPTSVMAIMITGKQMRHMHL
jgi:hypothetical protein